MLVVMSSSTANSQVKTIYLIRHAESEENRRLSSLKRIGSNIASLRAPNSSDIRASFELINVAAQVDSSVSPLGHKQIENVRNQLEKDNFIDNVELIVHSPLERAKVTCHKLFPSAETQELEYLIEKTPAEWMPGNGARLQQRLQDLQTWLSEQKASRIALVGHSQYFRNLIGLKFDNCDVWKVEFDPSATFPKEIVHAGKTYKLPPKWDKPERIYSCSSDLKTNRQDAVH